MCNLPVRLGKGILSIYPPERKFDFLEILGKCVYVKNEDEMDKFCAIIGAGSGFCYKLFDVYAQKCQVLDFEDQINFQEVVSTLFEGSLALCKSKEKSFEEMKQSVINPGGPTEMGIW